MLVDKLTFQILRATWALEPRLAISFTDFVGKLITGQLNSVQEKAPLKAFAFSENGDKQMLYQDDENENQQPQSQYDKVPAGSIAVIPLRGEMFKEDTWCSYGTETIAETICQAASSKNIKSILIDGDSGGGSVDSIAPLLDARNFVRKMGKKIIGRGDLIASAALYFFESLDLVIAANDISSSFGSVGVMVTFEDVRPYYEKMGVKFHWIKATESDYKNLPFELALKGDYDLIKTEMLSPLARKFQSDVRLFRAGKIDIKQKGILNGKMYFANDAVKYGFADEIGDFEYAIKRANELAISQ
jgi:protease-4